jgi:hypothetical protein
MGDRASDPPRKLAKSSEQRSVECRQGATRECESTLTIMWEERVGVLEESDKYQPVIHPKVGDEVSAEHFSKAASHRPGDDSGKPKENANIRDEHLRVLMRRKEWLCGVEIYTIVRTKGGSALKHPYD